VGVHVYADMQHALSPLCVCVRACVHVCVHVHVGVHELFCFFAVIIICLNNFFMYMSYVE